MRSLVLLAALLAPVVATTLQFDVEVERQKCLGQILSKHDVAKGRYRVMNVPEGSQSFVEMRITAPNGDSEIHAPDATGGKFAFTASDHGLHRVCFMNRWQATRRIELEFASGVDAKDYGEIAKNEHLKPLELELRKLEDRVEGIHREMMYQRDREEAHRDTNESTNSRVMWFSVLNVAVVLLVTAVQVLYLHSDLKKRKVV